MANNKKKITLTSNLAQQQENIRKAKGNPNKHVHHKKNGSNYGGGDYLAKKQSARQTVQRRETVFDMNRTQGIVFAVLLLVAVVGVILSFTVWKQADAERYLPAVLMGLPSIFLAYVGFTNRDKPRSGFQSLILILLAACGVYALVALLGLLGLLKA